MYEVINPSATLHSPIYFWGRFIFSSACSPTSCPAARTCPTPSSPCWHLPAVTSNCPLVESSVAPQLLAQRRAPNDSHKYPPAPPHPFFSSLLPLPLISLNPPPPSTPRGCLPPCLRSCFWPLAGVSLCFQLSPGHHSVHPVPIIGPTPASTPPPHPTPPQPAPHSDLRSSQ